MTGGMSTTKSISRTDIAPASGYEKVVSFIKEQLISGALNEGDMLLPERELAAALGVSRPLVREALRALAIIGVVEVLHGVGTVVRRPNSQTLGEFFSIGLAPHSQVVDDIIQARIAIECQAIRLACRFATAADFMQLEAGLVQIERTLDDAVEGARADFEFHRAIVQASRSQALISIYAVISDLLMRSHVDRRQKINAATALQGGMVDAHRELIAVLQAGLPDAADLVLRQHFTIGADNGFVPGQTP